MHAKQFVYMIITFGRFFVKPINFSGGFCLLPVSEIDNHPKELQKLMTLGYHSGVLVFLYWLLYNRQYRPYRHHSLLF